MTESIKTVIQPVTSIYEKKSELSEIESEALFGERFKIKKYEDHWVYGTLLSDNYDGWIKHDHLGEQIFHTHIITVIRTHIYNNPSSKALSLMPLSIGSKVKVLKKNDLWAEIEIKSSPFVKGYIPLNHLSQKSLINMDWVEISKLFIGTPYLWGGISSFGIDCSALIQLSLNLSGVFFPRNSLDQFNFLKKNYTKIQHHQKGDFIYWKDHIGLVLNKKEMLHANGYHMLVTVEPIIDVFSRIGEGKFLRL